MGLNRLFRWSRRIASGIISWVRGLAQRGWFVVPGKGGDMYFHFGTRKVIEAAGLLLRCRANRRMSYLRLLKLLYIADRESLGETGRPIIGTRPVAMDHGPVHSEVLDWINGKRRGSEEWARFIGIADTHYLVLTTDPGQLTLSQYEVDKLQEVCRRYEGLTRFQLADLTHDFWEWQKNFSEGTSKRIPLADIVEAVGRKADQDEIGREAVRQTRLRRFFGAAV